MFYVTNILWLLLLSRFFKKKYLIYCLNILFTFIILKVLNSTIGEKLFTPIETRGDVEYFWFPMTQILYDNNLIPNRSIAASIGGRNDMGRLLSPAGRNIIMNNIAKHQLPLIKKTKLAENIALRMNLFQKAARLKNYKAMINVGGGVASLGTSFNSKLLPAGIVLRSNIQNISIQDGGIEGVLSRFSKNNTPILHVLNIKSLTEQLGMPFAPIPIPDIGLGPLYAIEKYNTIIALFCLILICGSVFIVGYQSKKEIKEHLVNHEPDSLL